MKDLKVPVTTLPKIGPKTGELLRNLNIETIEDLLTHFPFRYEDLAEIKRIKNLEINESTTIEVIIQDINNVFTRNGKKLTKATAVDATGQIEVVWFNQHYLTSSIKKGKRYYLTGKVGGFNNKKNFVSPQYEVVSENSLNSGRLVPVYNETKGINSKWIRDKVHFILSNLIEIDPLEDILPEDLRVKEKFRNINDSLNMIHFPENQSEIKEARERIAFEEIFLELLQVERQKHDWHQSFQGIELEFNRYEEELNKMISSLPFTLTQAQRNVLEEIKKDVKLKHPMNRLLEGDVGSGKTIVAIIAAYLCHLNGYKTLYMAPTAILAKQHYDTYMDFLGEFGVEVKLLTGTNKIEVMSSKNDIIVGTHALLFAENIHNVGLIIIDEQHKFGVEQRAKLLTMGTKEAKPNLLTMTATPIPRTLALTIYGDLDLSVLDAVPNKDKKITTKVMKETHRNKVMEWILDKGEQAFIVCPLIEDSESEMFADVKAAETEYKKLKAGVFKNVSIGLLHGRMTSQEKDKVMEDFRNKKYQVLVATPVIEVGVDIPDATIIVIESAERFGLASLHQLRGRVGRGKKEGYCFLFMSKYSAKSYDRLLNLEKMHSGMELAEIDMQNRGQGDVFGTMQHGFKKFKVADLSDLEMIQRAKNRAQEYFKNIDKYPRLKDVIISENILIHNN